VIIAVIGSRNFSDYKLLESTLAVLPEITKIVSGGAKGADSLAEIYAEKYQLPFISV
jgi:predicted Rossmann fold nucleotide-binding protein DprA/Smf involved in DNA uptake